MSFALSNEPAFKIKESSIPDRELSRKHNNYSNVVTALPKRLEHSKLRNHVKKVVQSKQADSKTSLSRKKSFGTCLNSESMSAFKNYDASQQGWMEKLRAQKEDQTDKEVSKLTNMLMKENEKNRGTLLSTKLKNNRGTGSTNGDYESEGESEVIN